MLLSLTYPKTLCLLRLLFDEKTENVVLCNCQHIIFSFLFAFLIACSEEDQKEDICLSSLDCPTNASCVIDRCVVEKSECETLGAFEHIVETSPQNMKTIRDIKLSFDGTGAVHYCYHGFKDDKPTSFYGYQKDTFDFEEEEIAVDDRSIVCSAISISSDGDVYLFSKSPPALVHKNAKQNESWKNTILKDFEEADALGALASSKTMVSLVDAKDGGVYLLLSMGGDTTSQRMYVSHFVGDMYHTILNGLSSEKVMGYSGRNPQIVEFQDTRKIVFENPLNGSIYMYDPMGKINYLTQGSHIKVKKKDPSNYFLSYLDHNDNLIQAELSESGLMRSSSLGELTTDLYSAKHTVPYKLVVDQMDRFHLLFEDILNGYNTLSYRLLDSNGKNIQYRIISSNVSEYLSSEFQYDIYVDKCNSPYFIYTKDSEYLDSPLTASTDDVGSSSISNILIEIERVI